MYYNISESNTKIWFSKEYYRMLLSYKFNNYLSFNQEAEFTMLAPLSKVKSRYPNNYIELANGYSVLKEAVIVGENAGGKSNFVRSLSYFKNYFYNSDIASAYKSAIHSNNINGRCPRKTDSNQTFEIEITEEQGCIFKYFLRIDYFGIVEENLYVKQKKTAQYKEVFRTKRTSAEFDCDSRLDDCNLDECKFSANIAYQLNTSGVSEEIRKALEKTIDSGKTKGLFVTKLALLGNKSAIDFIDIIKNDICPEPIYFNYDLQLSMKKDTDVFLDILRKEEFFEIFRMVDYSICKLEIDSEKPFSDTLVCRKGRNGEMFKRMLSMDSSGVREFFAWAIQIYRVIYENKVVIADEMDRVLNPILSDRVISFINGKKHFGQLIFTSHNILQLDLKNYMKEQIYFISKDVETLESELYSLADFPEVRYETTKIYEFYMKGILGGTASE